MNNTSKRQILSTPWESQELRGDEPPRRDMPDWFLDRIKDRYLKEMPSEEISTLSLATVLFYKGYSNEAISSKLGVDKKIVRHYAKILRVGGKTDESNDHDLARGRLNATLWQYENAKLEGSLVTFGTTPSGPLHLANIYTMVNGVATVSEIFGNRGVKPRFVCGFNDFLVREEEFEKVPARKVALEEALNDIGREFNTSISVKPFSELQRSDRFRELLDRALREQVLRSIDVFSVKDGKYSYLEKPLPLKDDVDYAITDVNNVIGMRVATDQPFIHILGGDNAHAGRNFRIPRQLGLIEPHLLGMGAVFGLNGCEMHVSAGNYIPYEKLKDQPGIVKAIRELGKKPSFLVGPLDYIDLLPGEYTKAYGLQLPNRKAS